MVRMKSCWAALTIIKLEGFSCSVKCFPTLSAALLYQITAKAIKPQKNIPV